LIEDFLESEVISFAKITFAFNEEGTAREQRGKEARGEVLAGKLQRT
jgi:hypothetical protein